MATDSNVSAERLFELLENVPAGIIVVDAGGNVIYANPAWKQLFGIELTEELTRTPIRAIDVRVAGTDEPYPEAKRPVSAALRGEHARASDLEVRIGGRSIVVDVDARPIRNSDGNVA